MSMKAIKDLYTHPQSLLPAARTASANGTGVDLANAIENEFVIVPGAWTDGTHTFKLQESADNAAWNDVAAADQVGTLTAISSSPTAVVNKVSYIGKLRYVRWVVTVAGATTGAVYGAHAVLKLRKQPCAN